MASHAAAMPVLAVSMMATRDPATFRLELPWLGPGQLQHVACLLVCTSASSFHCDCMLYASSLNRCSPLSALLRRRFAGC